jgi:hypothetical protein
MPGNYTWTLKSATAISGHHIIKFHKFFVYPEGENPEVASRTVRREATLFKLQ